MSSLSGNLRKMQVSLPENPQQAVNYQMVLGDHRLPLNELIGQQLQLIYEGQIGCVHCGRATKKSFNQGYCYPCFKSLAQCDQCIVSPERCHYDAGTCREPEWADEFCMQDHYVYLANSSGLKVGITRGTQIPTRWIDQGASQALAIYRVSTRLYAGLVEVVFKQHMSDKTHWQAMLKGSPEPLDLKQIVENLMPEIEPEIAQLQKQYGLQAIQRCDDASTVHIQFPVLEYPVKIKSLNFDKTPKISGKLMGIKGQYLILDTGVLNLRKFGGYYLEVRLDVSLDT